LRKGRKEWLPEGDKLLLVATLFGAMRFPAKEEEGRSPKEERVTAATRGKLQTLVQGGKKKERKGYETSADAHFPRKKMAALKEKKVEKECTHRPRSPKKIKCCQPKKRKRKTFDQKNSPSNKLEE